MREKVVGIDAPADFKDPEELYGILIKRIRQYHPSEGLEVIDKAYEGCLQQKEEALRSLYEPFTAEELNTKMVELLRPEGVTCPIELVFQSLENLHKAIPNHPGDWYFSGHYPTEGGVRLACKSFVDWYEKNIRK